MGRVNRKMLVIDACVAGSAGGEQAIAAPAKSCRDFLIAVLDNGHKVVLPTTLRVEWEKHASRFTRKWRTVMVSKDRVWDVEPPALDSVKAKVLESMDSESQERAIEKDFHLIEAAIDTDQTVVSTDEEVRNLLVKATHSVVKLRKVVWVNPSFKNEKPIPWVKSGAKSETWRQLGYKAGKN